MAFDVFKSSTVDWRRQWPPLPNALAEVHDANVIVLAPTLFKPPQSAAFPLNFSGSKTHRCRYFAH